MQAFFTLQKGYSHYMSSHHFVKENQEPALLILDTKACTKEVLDGFLEWNPSVIVDFSLWDDIGRWGIKVDVVLINDKTFSSLSEDKKTELAMQAPIRKITYNDNESPVELAINHLGLNNFAGLNIIIDKSRIKLVQDQLIPYLSAFTITLYSHPFKIYNVKLGNFEKWAREKQTFQISPPVKDLEFSGLIQNNRKALSFIAQKEGKISIKSKQPFWLFEEV